MTHASCAAASIKSGSAATPITPQKLAEKIDLPTKMLQCEVVFGSPSLDCGGTGICRITGTNSIKPFLSNKNCRRTYGHIAVAGEGKFSLYFYRPLLCVHLYRQHFYKGVFSVSETCSIPSEIAVSLGSRARSILPGQYAVVEQDGYFRVDLFVS